MQGYEKITEAYGYWPSFHDANVKVTLDEGVNSYDQTKRVGLDLVVHEMTREIRDGYFVGIKYHRIELEFLGVHQSIQGVCVPNDILFDLQVENSGIPGSEECHVTMSFNCGGENADFLAESGRVLSVIPCDEEGIVKNKL